MNPADLDALLRDVNDDDRPFTWKEWLLILSIVWGIPTTIGTLVYIYGR